MTNQHMVTENEQNKRVDKLLTELIGDISRSQVQTWLADGHVHVNNGRVKAHYKCQAEDMIEWSLPETEETAIEPEAIPLSIVYEDDDLLVVNKPRGMVIHPSAGHSNGTLVNALLHHCDHLSEINGPNRPGIVHRIDKDTSGLVAVAKNDQAHINLAEQLSTKTMERQYEAVVHGVINHETGLIDAPIGRDPNDRKRMGIVETGKDAVTHFRVLARFNGFTHVSCRLETGRTHQIRVHMKYSGYPIAGDPKYGPRKTLDTGGQVLYAKSLQFNHPRTAEPLYFDVAAPEYFQELLAQLKKDVDRS
ncbi:RluA family pseudouridine synthase [Barrientosiimonas marina]|uniref:Pseudouridine synthase n=1 Tax=Lentibacillus kimchii TaxID=1542911 RepID=A0ABW2URK4_9BACI